jgi:hypothetical protein
MATLITIETILLVLLTLLVAGLLRSHAEILRRLTSSDSGASDRPEDQPDLPPARPDSVAAFDIVGTTLTGDAAKISVHRGPNTLLAFLSSGCLSCQPLWEGLHPPHRPSIPGGARIVVVTKDPAYESSSRLRDLAPRGLPLVMSSAGWEAYRVQGSPYFIYVDGRTGTVVGEGTATGWQQVISLIRDAFADAELAAEAAGTVGGHSGRRGTRGVERARRAEDELLVAGIGPGHPSLHDQSDEPAGGGADV